jgi:hypothetical protein
MHAYANAILRSTLLVALWLAHDFSVASAKDQSRVQQLIDATGMDVSFDTLGKSIAKGFEQIPPADPKRANLIAAAEKAAAASYDPATLKSQLLKDMEGRLAPNDLDAILAFYNEPVAQRMTAIENAAQGTDALEKMQAMAAELGQKMRDDPKRAALLETLNKTIGMTEAAVDTNINLQRAMITGMAAADGRAAEMTPEVIDGILQKARPEITDQMAKLTTVALAYTYRDASLEDLEAYVRFLASPAGQKLYEAGRLAKNRVLTEASLQFGEQLLKNLEGKRL